MSRCCNIVEMRNILRIIAIYIWALWLGGLITTFIFVLTLFHEDHDLAAKTAPRLFHAFERYQLILAGALLLSTILLKKTWTSVLFVLTAIGAVVSPLLITPRLSEMQRLGQTHTPEFGQIHGLSMLVYNADAVLLLLAGLMLLKRSSHRGGEISSGRQEGSTPAADSARSI
jgi:uncharacterized protein DUF4149